MSFSGWRLCSKFFFLPAFCFACGEDEREGVLREVGFC